MTNDQRIVRIARDEFRGHTPLWFPPPIFDDQERMPVSSELLVEFVEWNDAYNSAVGRGGDAVARNSHEGLILAKRLKSELGDEYEVQILMTGTTSAGWTTVDL